MELDACVVWACQASATEGVWYVLDVPRPSLVDLSTFGSDFDTQLSLYSTPDDVCVARNDDDVKVLTSRIRVRLPAGSYRVLVHGYLTSAGAYVLQATCT